VQTVGHLDEHDAYVGRHREQQFAEVLGLERGLVAEDAARDLGESLDYVGDLGAEIGLYVLAGELGVLDDVVEQGGAYRGRAEAQLGDHDAGHGDGVQDVGLAAAAAHPLMGGLGKPVGTLDDLYLLAVVGRKIG
jgi:hypothetical protein